jgi:hypothetical protein
MSTKKSSIEAPDHPQVKFIPSTQPELPSSRTQGNPGEATRQQSGGAFRFGDFFRECWRRMLVMQAAFEQSQP